MRKLSDFLRNDETRYLLQAAINMNTLVLCIGALCGGHACLRDTLKTG
jgi:hypothetical protein